jgi:hypothetical protein
MTGELRMGTPAGRWVLATTVLGSGIVMIDGTVVVSTQRPAAVPIRSSPLTPGTLSAPVPSLS